jgi:hypothetical protein
MVKEKNNTTILVPIMEMLCINMPYISHNEVLAVAIRNIVSETSLVDFDFQVLITCGKKVVHDNAPAIIPTTSLFIYLALMKSYTESVNNL